MDLQMPGMNGLDAMAAIRNEFPDARIIILTTYDSDVKNDVKRGARAYPRSRLIWIRNFLGQYAPSMPESRD
jgi:DNA-binding NarL/FixJ family response regulator